MWVNVSIFRGALSAADPLRIEGAGAIICFEGIVRGLENGRALRGLEYEAYDPMTLRELEALARNVFGKHGLLAIQVEHSIGSVKVGETSFRLQVASVHRQEGIAAMDEFIDRLKQEVPLWKVPAFADSRRDAVEE